MNNKIWITIVIVLLVALGIALTTREGADSVQQGQQQTQNPPVVDDTNLESTVPAKGDLIRVTSLRNNQVIDGALTITGEARGQWYFEGSFPVRIEDANGKVLGQVPAEAQGEWTTPNYVPFSLRLIFDKPQTSTGTIIFQKSNPSGLSENDDELRVPIQFN